jgi:hypothetical protein
MWFLFLRLVAEDFRCFQGWAALLPVCFLAAYRWRVARR